MNPLCDVHRAALLDAFDHLNQISRNKVSYWAMTYPRIDISL